MSYKKVELLAPAGDYECFLAAINAGADAIYLAGDKFGARAYAKNFNNEEIIEAINYAHLFNRKVYITLNTVIKEDEFYELYDYVYPLINAGVDGFIVQDIGVITYLRKRFPLVHVHASTQMAVTDKEGLCFLKKMGIKRVVLARELSLSEIKGIHEYDDMELECFIHGALCYCYSGKCLMSSFIGGRSGNRGRCAQPCRLPYNDEYILSAKDIYTLDIIPDLINAGIASFKIEGRMKSPDYVATVTGIYRKYIDLYYAICDSLKDAADTNERFKLSKAKYSELLNKKDCRDILNIYTRSGNSNGYYYTYNGRDMITISKPGYKTASEEEKNALFEKYGKTTPKIEINMQLILKKNNASCLRINDIEVIGEIVPEAIKQPLSYDSVYKQINKLGGTVFICKDLDIEMDSDIFMPLSKLNELRRRAIDKYTEKLLREYMLNTYGTASFLSDTEDPFADNNKEQMKNEKPDISVSSKTNIDIHVQVLNLVQFYEALENDDVDIITVSQDIVHDEQLNLSDLCDAAHSRNKQVYFSFPYVIRKDYLSKNTDIYELLFVEKKFDGALVANYESLDYLLTNNFEYIIITDFYLYALNKEAYKAFKNLGDIKTTVPVELNKKEILRRGVTGEDMIVYGRIPLMTSTQCIKKTGEHCNKKPEFINIKDRTNTIFYAYSNCDNCYNVIYNSVPISLHNELKLVNRIEVGSVRLLFTNEKPAEMRAVLKDFIDVYKKNLPAKYMLDKEYTKGHFGRGVE